MRSPIPGILGSLVNCKPFMTLYKNKYRIESARKPGWDYAANGAYFITICTRDRRRFFGDIQNRKMNLSIAGEIAHKFWHEIPDRFPHVQLDAFVVMPNHIHGILVIDRVPISACRDAINRVSTTNLGSLDFTIALFTAAPISIEFANT